jgi:hypothetical protein
MDNQKQSQDNSDDASSIKSIDLFPLVNCRQNTVLHRTHKKHGNQTDQCPHSRRPPSKEPARRQQTAPNTMIRILQT